MFSTRIDRVLALSAVSVLTILGLGELIARLDDPTPLFFWLPTLWGGAALILAGGFLVKGNLRLAKTLVILGCAVGWTPSVWTLVMPVLLITLVIRTVRTRPKEPLLNLP
ncbi:MAG: hypothetical protein WEA76_11075 [Acidimicrobiia bacterium]